MKTIPSTCHLSWPICSIICRKYRNCNSFKKKILKKKLIAFDLNLFSIAYAGGDPLYLLDIESSKKESTVTTHVNASYFNMQIFHKGHILQVMKERLRSLPLAIYCRKNSFLSFILSDKILELQANGLIYHWSSKFFKKKLLRPSKQIFHEPLRLRVGQVLGVLKICGFLYFIAFCVFILEIVVKKVVACRS